VKNNNRDLKPGYANPFRIEPVVVPVYEDEGFRSLDCDVQCACVDRPLGRYILNLIAFPANNATSATLVGGDLIAIRGDIDNRKESVF
jgi:hypothetical protein